MGSLDQEPIEQLLCEARWRGADSFGCSKVWNKAHSQWLQVAKCHGQQENYMTRLRKCNKNERQETFSELAVAYVLEEIVGLKILQWAPNDGRGECMLNLKGVPAFCEVKSPGWEAEIVAEASGKPPLARLQQSKDIPGQAFAYATHSIVRQTIEKARKKFPARLPGLLVFDDDFRVSLIDDPLDVQRVLYRELLPAPNVDSMLPGYFLDPGSKWLMGIVIVNCRHLASSGEIEYRIRCCPNYNSSDVVLLEKAFSRWIEPGFPVTASWGTGPVPRS